MVCVWDCVLNLDLYAVDTRLNGSARKKNLRVTTVLNISAEYTIDVIEQPDIESGSLRCGKNESNIFWTNQGLDFPET